MQRIAMLTASALVIGMGGVAIACEGNNNCKATNAPNVSATPWTRGSHDSLPAPRHQQLACEGGNWPNNCRALPEPTDTGLPQGYA